MIRVAHPTRPAPALAAGAPLLDVVDLHVHYAGIRALSGVSMRVDPGEIVAVIGANGAGKTTALKAIARLVPIASGTVRFAGADVRGESADAVAARGVSLVPEGRAIFPTLTVAENLAVGAYAHRHPVAMQETIDDVVRLFPRLGERMKQPGGTLSGGEQQMLAIGRALMARPSLLLLDEPSLGIAPKLAVQIFDAIRAIADGGLSVLLVEQNTRWALSTASRAYVLQTGAVAMEGPAPDLARDPEIRAAYLGG